MTPDASIVVIVQNGEATIAKCLESLLSQKVIPEIVVVDGNSTDKTREMFSPSGSFTFDRDQDELMWFDRTLCTRNV